MDMQILARQDLYAGPTSRPLDRDGDFRRRQRAGEHRQTDIAGRADFDASGHHRREHGRIGSKIAIGKGRGAELQLSRLAMGHDRRYAAAVAKMAAPTPIVRGLSSTVTQTPLNSTKLVVCSGRR
jgi:hypothetical protein